jgi:hypothetical protein
MLAGICPCAIQVQLTRPSPHRSHRLVDPLSVSPSLPATSPFVLRFILRPRPSTHHGTRRPSGPPARPPPPSDCVRFRLFFSPLRYLRLHVHAPPHALLPLSPRSKTNCRSRRETLPQCPPTRRVWSDRRLCYGIAVIAYVGRISLLKPALGSLKSRPGTFSVTTAPPPPTRCCELLPGPWSSQASVPSAIVACLGRFAVLDPAQSYSPLRSLIPRC